MRSAATLGMDEPSSLLPDPRVTPAPMGGRSAEDGLFHADSLVLRELATVLPLRSPSNAAIGAHDAQSTCCIVSSEPCRHLLPMLVRDVAVDLADQHSAVLVSHSSCNRHEVDAGHDGPADKVVARVMESYP